MSVSLHTTHATGAILSLETARDRDKAFTVEVVEDQKFPHYGDYVLNTLIYADAIRDVSCCGKLLDYTRIDEKWYTTNRPLIPNGVENDDTHVCVDGDGVRTFSQRIFLGNPSKIITRADLHLGEKNVLTEQALRSGNYKPLDAYTHFSWYTDASSINLLFSGINVIDILDKVCVRAHELLSGYDKTVILGNCIRLRGIDIELYLDGKRVEIQPPTYFYSYALPHGPYQL